MKALITGGSGYFGSLLVNRLLMNKWQCRVLDINNYSGSEEVEFYNGNILIFFHIIHNVSLLRKIFFRENRS